MTIRESRMVVVVGCSGRKRRPKGSIVVPLDPITVPSATLSSAALWVECLREAESCSPAQSVYMGRNNRLAQDTAALLGVDLLIASAGLGLVRSSQPIPLYEATISSRNNIARIFGLEERDWWTFLMSHSPYATSWPSPDVTVLVAAPRAYLRMITPHLEAHPVDNLRIFTRGDVSDLPAGLRRAVLPYDARFDGPQSPIPGTVSDFHTRILAHFARYILAKAGERGLDEHRAMVESALAGWTATRRSPGRSASDLEIRALIRACGPGLNYRSTAILRHLRDNLSVACEQKRFQQLFRSVVDGEGDQSCLPV